MADTRRRTGQTQPHRSKEPYDRSEYRITVQPDLSTTFWAKEDEPLPPGGPWIGMQNLSAPDPSMPSPDHYAFARLIYWKIQHPKSPAWVEITPTDTNSGDVAVTLKGMEFCQTREEQERAIFGLNVAYTLADDIDQTNERSRGGRTPTDTDAYIAALRNAYHFLKAKQETRPSHSAYARIAGRATEGAPIKKEASKQRLRRVTPRTSFEELADQWDQEGVQN